MPWRLSAARRHGAGDADTDAHPRSMIAGNMAETATTNSTRSTVIGLLQRNAGRRCHYPRSRHPRCRVRTSSLGTVCRRRRAAARLGRLVAATSRVLGCRQIDCQRGHGDATVLAQRYCMQPARLRWWRQFATGESAAELEAGNRAEATVIVKMYEGLMASREDCGFDILLLRLKDRGHRHHCDRHNR